MSNVDVSFVDPRILAAVEAANYTVRDTPKNGLKTGTYEVDFGKGQYFATLAVNKESGVTDKTLAVLAERRASLSKVIANYEAPLWPCLCLRVRNAARGGTTESRRLRRLTR
jgi:hypothetical protein